MKKILTAIFIIIALCSIVFTQSGQIRLSVSPFDDTVTAAGEREKAGAGISARLESAFSKVGRFYVRPADAIKDYINNLTKVQLGLTSPDLMTGLSGTLQVDYLTVGTISKFNNRYEVDARTVDINDWSIVHSYGCSAESIDAAIKDIEWYISEQFTSQYLASRKTDNEDRSTVSVFRFRDGNRRAVSAGYSGAFSEILNSQLGSYTGITTIERKYTRALIEEKTLEMLGVVENNDSDKALKIKGIDYKMEGDIRVFEDVITLNYRLYDTSSGRIAYMGSRDITSANTLRPAARVIANTIEDVLGNRAGTLKITSLPSMGRVYIDGKMMGLTPVVITAEKGSRTMQVIMDGYESYEQNVDVTPRSVMELSVKLNVLSVQGDADEKTAIDQGKSAEEINSQIAKEYKIGDIGPGGGFVFYDKGNSNGGWRYLEAAPVDLTEAEWGCYETEIPGAKGTGIGKGRTNTRAIIKGCSEDRNAAKVAAAYRGGGKADWFLPSKDELNLIRVNLKKAGVGGFEDYFYWSSSEYSPNLAWYQVFGNGLQVNTNKYNPFAVRAVRAFK